MINGRFIATFLMLVAIGSGSFVLLAAGDTPKTGDVRRQECIRDVENFLGQLLMDHEVRSRVTEARRYYDRTLFAYKLRLPDHTPIGCREFHNQMQSMPKKVPCYYDTSIVGHDETRNIVDVVNTSEAAKYAVEAEFACAAGRLAGRELRDHGLFEAVVGPKLG